MFIELVTGLAVFEAHHKAVKKKRKKSKIKIV